MVYCDRLAAGRVLARQLSAYQGRSDVVVLGLPRGGVPVAEPVAEALKAPLDVFVVRKLGVPGHEELAMGAVASGGVRVRNDDVVKRLRISDDVFDEIARREEAELGRRELAYRSQTPVAVEDRTVILVDDGLATGATMRAAVRALRAKRAARVVVAVPVGAADSCAEMSRIADDVICAEMPEPFQAVGMWYDDFSQTSDDEVRAVLDRARRMEMARATPVAPAAKPRLGDLCRRHAQPLVGKDNDYDRLIDGCAGARVVLIGEATHGTHEFFRERAEITKRLITECDFAAVAVAADWPDAYRVNRFVRGHGPDLDPLAAVGGFARFPAWMWRSAEALDFIAWLRGHNDQCDDEREKAGFYGLDIFSLYTSMETVVECLDRVDPVAAARAAVRHASFDRMHDQIGTDELTAGFGLTASLEQEVVARLTELRRHAAEFASASPLAADEPFFAEQNARVAKNAETYYHAMLGARTASWNLRDRHMMGTLQSLGLHLAQVSGRHKIVVWAHNAHVGDARATQLGAHGELSLGQLVREAYGDESALVGMTTYAGTVAAASAWGAPVERKALPPALPGSYEALFHEVGLPRFCLPLRGDDAAVAGLRTERLERAIGALYWPPTERAHHYFHARMADQFDAVIHIDKTHALLPLERSPDEHVRQPAGPHLTLV